jgi:hypothetical protein
MDSFLIKAIDRINWIFFAGFPEESLQKIPYKAR